ncbi:MAG: hypothetical protein HRU38_18935 [Saccharospirillaceae bacterium]|nr:hypothetical protein [Pseudomonadales bacterium]NRB80711.1 hypothetical protein [Saccharospirillaceae bacterium]
MIDPIEFSSRSRDAKTERGIAKWLRSQTEDERWEFIQSALLSKAVKNPNLPNALILTPKVGLKKEHLFCILAISLKVADPSSMQAFLKAVLPGLGYKRVVHYFKSNLIEFPEKVGMALYFLPNLQPEVNIQQRKLINTLRKELVTYVSGLDICSDYLKLCINRAR